MLPLGRCQDRIECPDSNPTRRSTRMWSYLIFCDSSSLSVNVVEYRVREHGTSRNDPIQTTIQVTLGSCNDSKNSNLSKLGVPIFESYKLQSWNRGAYGPTRSSAHPEGEQCVGGGSFHEEPFSDSNIFYFWVFWCMRPIVLFLKNLVFQILMNFHQLSHHVSSHATECPSLVLPYHFLIWILFSSYHFSPAKLRQVSHQSRNPRQDGAPGLVIKWSYNRYNPPPKQPYTWANWGK